MRAYAIIPVALLAAACETQTQFTSGADYLSRYTGPAAAAPGKDGRAIDGEIREIANVEPDLRFPARIGLARIERGRLSPVPGEEAEHWVTLTEDLGEGYGEFVPISPLVAAMVGRDTARGTSIEETVENIRRAAARQHVDYVLVYEASATHDDEGNLLSIAEWTIIGIPLVPSRNVSVNAYAQAMLIDVRNAYPYGIATAHAYDDALSSLSRSRDVGRRLEQDSRLEAVANLAEDVGGMMRELREIADAET